MQFRPPRPPQVRPGAQSTALLEVTVTVRWIPPVSAAYGTWVARPAITTRFAPGGDGSPARPEGEPVLGDHCLVGKPPKAAWQLVLVLARAAG